MALFRTRNNSDKKSETVSRKNSATVDTVDTLRARARQRLIGSTILLLAGIITFTVLLDNKPRPIPSDIEIIIPDKDKAVAISPVPESAAPATPPQAAPQTTAQTPTAIAAVNQETQVTTPGNTTSNAVTNNASNSATNSPNSALSAPTPAVSSDKPTKPNASDSKTVQAAASLDTKEELIPVKPAVKTEAKKESKADIKAETKTKPALDDGAKAQAILEGKDPNSQAAKGSTPSGSDRYIVQVGAFADAAKAREVRLKVERAGLKTYTHVAKTAEGARIRVRVGPFTNRVEADKAAEKIKKLNLPAAILTL